MNIGVLFTICGIVLWLLPAMYYICSVDKSQRIPDVGTVCLF